MTDKRPDIGVIHGRKGGQCAAFPCHCDGAPAQFVVSYANKEYHWVSQTCCDMALMAGYPAHNPELEAFRAAYG